MKDKPERMTANDRAELSAGLRELADAVENPRFPEIEEISVSLDANVWGWTDAVLDDEGNVVEEASYGIDQTASLTKLRGLVRGLGGRKKEKHYGVGGFTCKRTFGPRVSVSVSSARDAVCKRVATGNKIIRAAVTYPETVEEEYEWICDEKVLGAEYYA